MHSIPLYLIFLVWMVGLQPQAPWSDTYLETAVGIADVVESEEPLFRDDDTRLHTGALLIALAHYESRFDPDAWGDKGQGDSHGLFQQQRFGLLKDPREATRVALQQIRISARICRNRIRSERLGWYASGNEGCENPDGLKKSRHRFRLAQQLVGDMP